MARIGKAEHARILHMADVEQRRVADIAAAYGCSAANIYALLNKLRRAAPPTAAAPAPVPPPAAEPVPAVAAKPILPPPLLAGTVVDLFEAPPARTPAPAAPAPVRKAPATPSAPARPGMALVMRSGEGEESVAPFRSLEDLLGAIKPILRAAASSTEPVWFCIQPVDLATLDEEAA